VNGNMVRKTVKASGVTWRYGYTVYDELAASGLPLLNRSGSLEKRRIHRPRQA
jgi:hypothetical protein